MKITLIFIILVAVTAFGFIAASKERGKLLTTGERIAGYGYPVEVHNVETTDGYILTMFRIPYSPLLRNQDVSHKPVVYLQHGFVSSSDCWILNGPDNALAYLLVDAGYDVWLGNTRGNTYSKRNAYVSPDIPSFWDFSWNEVGTHDLPAVVDFILHMTDEVALHYVGHSQGTTAFLVFQTLLPQYAVKIKTSHMLAPVAYMKNIKAPFIRIFGLLLGYPSLLTELIGGFEYMPTELLLSLLEGQACADGSLLQPTCGNVVFLLGGFDPKHLNYTLLPDVVKTHPAGSSSRQIIHYVQEYKSGYFRQYDHGKLLNQKFYRQETPPEYQVENIQLRTPVQLYYGDNDFLSSPIDVLRLAERMGRNVELYHVEIPEWNHFDYLWALEVKEVINDRVISLMDEYELTFY